ncbi:MAG TPA: ELWxxDGT repeat protein [Pirellulales bacterium]|nr:ELWxxDGT repeat protein [Pirellulales bacterium]
MTPESLFRRFCQRLRKKTRQRPRFTKAGVLGRTIENLEDRSLLSATYLPINPTGAADPSNMAALGGQVLFAANDGSTGVELWKSDGTVSGTTLVKDINPGSTVINSVTTPNSSDPTDLVTVGGYVYFAANDGSDGTQLWRSDGTASGTTMVTGLNASGGGIAPADLTNLNGKLFFAANDGSDGTQVWTTDGTAAGTVMISNLRPSSGAADPSQLTAVGSSLFFTANAGASGTQLYVTSGSLAGTHLVYGVTNGTIGASPSDLTDVNGTLYYAGYDSVYGNQLWKSDGTAGGTEMVTEIGSGSSFPTSLTDVAGTLYFAANDGTHGVQLWKSDGTAAGTTMVADINTSAAGASSYPAELTDVDGVLYFRANDGVNGTQLWKSDGTAAGTTMVAAVNAGSVGSTPDNLTAANGYLFFTANDGVHGFELWQSDGTAAGTTLLADINPGAPSSNPSNLTSAGNTLFAAANDGTHGVSLYAAAIPTPRPVLAEATYYYSPGGMITAAAPGVLSGATPTSGTLTAVLVSPPSHGSLTLHSDGSFTYTPDAGFRGKDTFTVSATNGSSSSAQNAVVTVESSDYRWVANLYTVVLGRAAGAATDAEITYWVDQLAAGTTRAEISEVFTHSNEYDTHLVNGYFEQLLGRAADPSALSYFVAELEAGVSSDTVVAQIVSSSEFTTMAGSTNGFVSNLYNALLGRLPTGAEFRYWVGQLNAGVTPQEVASIFVASTEYREIAINNLYEQYLQRAADADGMAFWLAEFQNGQTSQALAATLAASEEFYAT